MTYNSFKKVLIDKFPIMGKYLSFNYGLIPEKLKETDYQFGAISKKVLVEDGNWDSYMPTPERQSGRGIETMACTCFSALNVIEAIMKKKFNLDVNYSDRFLAKLSGVTSSGNIQSKVMEAIRKVGLVKEEDYPSNMEEFDWNTYYSPIPSEVFSKAHEFLEEYEVNYEAILPTIPAMREALRYAPLYVAGYAWYYKDGAYRSLGTPNHCFVISNIDQAIAYKTAYDSYNPFFKKLGADYQIFYPKLLTVNKKGQEFNSSKISEFYNRGVKYFFRAEAHGEIYKLDTDKLTKIEPQEWLNINIREKAEKKELISINESFYNSLIN